MHALNLDQLSTSIVCFLHLEISSVLDERDERELPRHYQGSADLRQNRDGWM